MLQRFLQLKRQRIRELIAVRRILTERTCRDLDAHLHLKVVALIHCGILLNILINTIIILLLQCEFRFQFRCNRGVIQIDGILRFPGIHRRRIHFVCRLHCDLIVMAAVAVVGLAHVVAVSLIHEDGAGDIGEGNGHFRDSALDGTRNNGQRIVAYRLHDADGLVVGSSVFIIGDHIAGDGFVSRIFALGEVGKAHGIHIGAQRLQAQALRDLRLRDARIMLAERDERDVPIGVGVPVERTVAGVMVDVDDVAQCLVGLEVLFAFLVAKLLLCHGQQGLVPVIAQADAVFFPVVVGLHVGAIVRKARQRVRVFGDGAGQHLLIARLGVVMEHRLGNGLAAAVVRHRRGGVGIFQRRNAVIVCRRTIREHLALFVAADQLFLGLRLNGVAVVRVGVLLKAAEEVTCIGIDRAGFIVGMFFLAAGQFLVLNKHGLVAVRRVVVHLRFGLLRFRLFRLGFRFFRGRLRVHGKGGVRVFRLAFLITADQLLGITVVGMDVLFHAAAIFVVGGQRRAHLMQPPADRE